MRGDHLPGHTSSGEKTTDDQEDTSFLIWIWNEVLI